MKEATTKTKVDTRCGYFYPNKTRCKQEGNPCWLESAYEAPYEYLCSKHMFVAGYCPGCGLFWGGIESFEFSDHHLCENCEDELRSEMEDDDEDDWPGGYLP